MELRDLRYFVAVAQARSFSRAAEALHLAQPSLSQAIKKLENELGVALFARAHHLVELTDAGAAFLREARTVLAQAAVAADTARMVGNGTIGQLRIGFIDSSALRIMPELVRRYRAAHPGVRLHFIELSTAQQIAALKADEIDVGIARGPVWDPELAGVRVATEELYVALAATHPLAPRETLGIGELRDELFVLYPPTKGTGLYDEVLRLCHDAGFEPAVAQEVNEIPMICGLAASGAGVAIVPGSARVIAIEGLRYVRLEPPATIERWALWRETAKLPAIAAFVDVANGMADGADGREREHGGR
ncbi:MAG TPA: LysR family transcriptional regulator [Candidatus Sulfotelmatobacter sp.]|nr:LysR family transcriptional regulator [Candidatus Sulfotelmatobacter sp.]